MEPLYQAPFVIGAIDTLAAASLQGGKDFTERHLAQSYI
jgi:hypothetical protein